MTLFFFLTIPGISPGKLGGILFVILAFVTGLGALLLGPALTADCLSRERREGTLGLLFLTDLGGWDIVLGKLAAAAWNVGYGLLGVVPVLALPVLLGGVTPGQVGMLAVALLNGLFIGLAVGMVASSFCLDARQATGLAMIGVVGLTIFPWAIFLWLLSRDQPMAVPLASPVLLASPSVPFLQVAMPSLTATVPGNPVFPFLLSGRVFGIAVVGQHFVGWLLLWLVARRVRNIWQDKVDASASPGGRAWLARLRFGNPIRRSALRRRLLGLNPFLWLSQREIWKAFYPWLLLLGIAGGFLVGLWRSSSNFGQTAADFAPIFIVVAQGLLGLCLVSEAAYRLCEERQSGALELVLTTPLDERAILAGQSAGLRRLFLGPLVLLLLVDLWWATKADSLRWSFPDFYVGKGVLLGLLFYVRALAALRWIATSLALGGRAITPAVGGALGLGLIIPWMLATALFSIGLWVGATLGIADRLESVSRWISMTMALAWIEGVGWWSRHKSRYRFRELASRPPRIEARERWWFLWGRSVRSGGQRSN